MKQILISWEIWKPQMASMESVLPWRNRQRVRLLTERLVVRAHPGAEFLRTSAQVELVLSLIFDFYNLV